jgi:hypothetical protein
LPKECFEAAIEHEVFDYFKGKVFIGIGDFQQIAPVVEIWIHRTNQNGLHSKLQSIGDHFKCAL